jgi:hypothetical protein
MVHEAGIPIFGEWLLPALYWFGIISISLILIGAFGGFLVSATQHGPTEGFYRTTKVIFTAFLSDLPGFSLRRTLAIAWLAIQESLRKRVLLVVCLVFMVILVFAGWFLDPRSDHPGRIYLSFLLGATNWLVLLMSIFLATLSLPNDMKNKTIYTVVTKPVRSSEIVLGRVVGFVGVGTILILIMGLLSFVFVTRGLNHTHKIKTDKDGKLEIEEVRSNDELRRLVGYRGKTTFDGSHEHTVDIGVDGQGLTNFKYGHNHVVTRDADGNYTIGPPQGQLEARVPIYGKLSWFGRRGERNEKGINVGNEWEYRHYIPGGTKAAAVWKFTGITKEKFPDGLPLEFTMRVFRTYKGDITKPVLGSISLRNPNLAKNYVSAPFFHRFKEYETDYFEVPVKVPRLPDATRVETSAKEKKTIEELDLFEHLVEDGEVEVVIQCMEQGQYYGAAQADVYIRAPDKSFSLNFFKGLLSIWLQMVIIVTFGVFFSTFLSGPVAFLGSISTLVVGFFIEFIREVVHGIYDPDDPTGYKGGGPIESIVRISTQQNITTDLELQGPAAYIVKSIDKAFAALLYATTFFVPSFPDFDTVDYVAYGYNIDIAVVSIMLCKALSYAIGTTLVGYFILKTREIAAT